MYDDENYDDDEVEDEKKHEVENSDVAQPFPSPASAVDEKKCQEMWDRQVQSLYTADNGAKGLKMRRRPFQTQAEEEIEVEAAELCRMLMDDEWKKKKKERAVEEQVGLASKLKFGPESSERIKKNIAAVKQIIKSEGSYALKEISTKNK
ncbi:unnamed protein product [Fraxinus pennsylvanica]|uniref:Uncharacterized protein n=1 Tax=Fraxinus pennsylvanica TaxID=56036 RepID=A0AAD1ZH15_9LAMI|nr:unnamed protein product [Fraxinus pennsylvanica]